ncbi:unnamed protein product [Strongylus vulgaris]|uniref:Laminin EGF-like domain-containing protein n=1 Tax=Strongylus vulgaris TaxID=40348 RepID=A0A3P7IPU8_STRVU|nr:unnamed protein product [Strongylus vulgaris]
MDTDPVEQIETKFHELVAELSEERKRLLADHYGVFCRKIFRIVHFEPTDLTIWLTSAQKSALGLMIQDPNMYEFYSNTTGEAKEEAKDIIESGCRHFIAHMFGDDNAEEVEELRLAGTVSKQHLAAKLATHALEVSNEVDRKRAEGSLSICSRIYLGYDGSCECHNHAESCDSVQAPYPSVVVSTLAMMVLVNVITMLKVVTACMEGFTGDPLNGGCTLVEPEETPCTCNNHSTTCDSEGKCQSCLHNTIGDSCERCAAGFYGDATTGTADDCTRCPCPSLIYQLSRDNGDCFVNDNNLVECNKCPHGKRGITCDEESTVQREEDEGSKQSEEPKESSQKAQERKDEEVEKPRLEGEEQKSGEDRQQIETNEIASTNKENTMEIEGNKILYCVPCGTDDEEFYISR